MTPILREYLLKGLFLGLWGYLALIQNPSTPDWSRFRDTLAIIGGGLVVGLLFGAAVQIRRGYRPATNLKAFPLVVLLESPFWIYAGILGGLGVALATLYQPPAEAPWLIAACAGSGLLLGFGFQQLRLMKDWVTRFGLSLIVGALLTYIVVSYFEVQPAFDTKEGHRTLATVILAGLPFFYLLTFCGEAEESEVEIAALCAGLGLGLYFLFGVNDESAFAGKIMFLVPIAVYFVYVTRWMPFLRVFKHVLRGYSALHMGRQLDALQSFKRALILSPRDDMAIGGMWELHHRIDVAKLPEESPLLQHLDYDFCLDQAALTLSGANAPSTIEREKAVRMLDLVEKQRPKLLPRVDYLRAIAFTHAKEFDVAAQTLSQLLDPATVYDVPMRKKMLFPAWDLALRLHPELVKRLGMAELSKPGRRMEVIAATERTLAAEPGNATAQELKAMLYASLTETEYIADAASGPPAEFNYDYVEQIGLALVDNPESRERGMAFLRIAGRGLPERGPMIFSKLAEVAADNGDTAAATGYREQVKRAGQLIGPKQLPADQKALYFAAVKQLSQDAEAAGDYDNAIGDLRLYLENGSGELEIYRKLADLYEKKQDALNALLMAETGLVYNSKDKDMLARKDRYYASVDVERLQSVKEKVERFFDVEYCLTKAKLVLDTPDADLETLDWARHLTMLAAVIQPKSMPVKLVEARVLLRKGERGAALSILEDIREAKPNGSADQDAWYVATKMLGDLYLNELDRPDLAVHCFKDYRECSRSGADTLFYLAKSYEATGDTKNAIRFYEAVTAYDQHPKYWDAKEGIARLKG
ncbi:hypothetical protein BH11PLA2_BH11PLA2_37660 [soil metagenome]